MIDDWMISRLWEEIEGLKRRVNELEDDKREAEEKLRQAAMDEADRLDGQWYREVNGLGDPAP